MFDFLTSCLELFASSQPSAEQLKTESRRRRSQVSSATADITEFHLGKRWKYEERVK